MSRSPSWGAWIEMDKIMRCITHAVCRSPSWGAWIEIDYVDGAYIYARVAPPRGERGLKWI